MQYNPYTDKKFGLSIWEHFADQEDEKLYTKGRRTVVSDSLVVALGTDPAPTFSAIASHRLPNLFLCHTTDEGMRTRAEKLRDMIERGELFPHVKNVCLVPSDHAGGMLMRNLEAAEDARNVQVNITPGTKGQAAFLALWGKRHGFSVWSIHDGMALLDGPEGEKELIPAQSYDPVQLLELKYDEPVDCEPPLNKEQIVFYDLLLDHMRGCAAKGKAWGLAVNSRLPVRQSQTSSGIVLAHSGKGKWSITSPSARVFQFATIRGTWFERLSARALVRAGAEHVHTSVSLPWPFKLQTKLEEKYQDADGKQHRIEMDILCTWKTRLVLVSCKAGNRDALSQTALEARAMAGSVARFTTPIVCSLNVDEFCLENKVACLGWRELFDPGRLADVLDKACGLKRSTREPSREPSGATAPGFQGTDNPKPEKTENPA